MMTIYTRFQNAKGQKTGSWKRSQEPGFGLCFRSVVSDPSVPEWNERRVGFGWTDDLNWTFNPKTETVSHPDPLTGDWKFEIRATFLGLFFRQGISVSCRSILDQMLPEFENSEGDLEIDMLFGVHDIH